MVKAGFNADSELQCGTRCYTQVVKAGFNADYGLFSSTAEGGLAFPRPDSGGHVESPHGLLHFLGLVFGKALYEVWLSLADQDYHHLCAL